MTDGKTYKAPKGSMQVYLWQIDREIVTVLAHLQRIAKREVA